MYAGGLVLLTPFDPALFARDSCLATRFYGNYGAGSTSLFIPDAACLDVWSATTLASSASFVPLPVSQDSQLVWVEEKAIADELKASSSPFSEELEALVAKLSAATVDSGSLQDVLAPPATQVEVLHASESSALLSMSSAMAFTVDTQLPQFWKSAVVPTTAVTYQPVPSRDIKHVEKLLKTLKFDPVISGIVNNISVPQMRNDIRFLTGEDSNSGIVSRHSYSEGSRVAAAWLKDRFEDTGAVCELRPFLIGFAPNVICRYTPVVNTTATVLLSAHYDSRGSFGSLRAPGADDDGSGTTSLLAIARTIARRGVRFHSNVELVAFAGEEQGLYGSRAYSRDLRKIDANITIMIQADMLAYHQPGEPAQLGLPDLVGTPEVAQLIANVSAIYSPELIVGFTPACCSDHQSFHEQGFAASQVFERAGPIADPMYHNSGDLSDREGYDLDQVKSIAKVQFATLLHSAGFELAE